MERFRSAGADVTLTVDGDIGRLPATTGLAVYRILQEALTNAVKHAPGAPTAATAHRRRGRRCGWPWTARPRPAPAPGLGVVSMRERAESLGGTCQAGRAAGGWLVAATLPLAASRRPEAAT